MTLELMEPIGTKGAVKKDQQVKFYVPSSLMKTCNEIFDRQGVDLSEGMTRLIRLLVDAPDEMKTVILLQAHGNASVALAESVLRRAVESLNDQQARGRGPGPYGRVVGVEEPADGPTPPADAPGPAPKRAARRPR